MNAMFKIFSFLYLIGLLIIIPLIAYKFDNWYILFGIAFCYLGVVLAARKPILIRESPQIAIENFSMACR